MKLAKLNALAGLAALSGLAACATAPPQQALLQGPTAADNHQISVEQTSQRMEIAVGAQDMALSPASRGELRSFASTYSRMGHGPIVISTPSNGANTNAAARIAQQARVALADMGVPYGAVAGATYDGDGQDAPIIVSFMHYEATAPECTPIWAQDLAHPAGNSATYESFGCSAQVNLAAMIEDPRDLLQPRDETPRDAARRAVVLGHYREGEPTAATRSSEERIRISDAVD